MHDLEVIKDVCTSALNRRSDSKNELALFYSVVDPESVMELIRMVEESITPHELETLMILVRNLSNYLESAKEIENNITLPDRDDLVRQAKYALSLYAR